MPSPQELAAASGIALESFHYIDLNGDSVLDLVLVSSSWDVFAFLNHDGRFTDPFRAYVPSTEYRLVAGKDVTFRDWTSDKIPELVFDQVVDDEGEPGYFIRNWYRSVMHCEEDLCWNIWDGRTASLGDISAYGGMHYYWSGFRLPDRETSPEPDVIQDVTGFRLYAGPDKYAPLLDKAHEPQVNDASTMAASLYVEAIDFHFCWDGHTLNECGELPIIETRLTTGQAQLDATSRTGDRAIVEVLPWPGGSDRTFQNDVCQLTVDGSEVGVPFGCKRNFVTVEWRDVFGNGTEQLYVRAISGYRDGLDRIPPTWFMGRPCVYQRLILYDYQAGQATELANVLGCVDEPSLVGAAVMDFDHDDQLEIAAGPRWEWFGDCPETQQDLRCWHELHTGYELHEWNGTRFVPRSR